MKAIISRRLTIKLLAITLVATLALPIGDVAAKKLKIALALPGAVSDKGFNASAHAGLMLIKKRLGADAEVAFSENVKRPDFVTTLRDYANRGFDVIYAHGFQWGDAIAKVAAENPKKYFFNVYGIGKAPNLASLHVANEELFHVLGQVAAKLSKTNVIGAVGGWEIPPIRIQIDAFMKGVLKANPNAKFRAIYTGTFYDAVKGKEAARALISQKADVIAHMADSTGLGSIQAAKILSIGYFADQRSVAPNSVATSGIINVPELFWLGLKSVMDNKFKSGVSGYGLNSVVLSVGPYGPMVPQKTQDEISKLVEEISTGKIKIPRANVPELMKKKINKI
jgi:basic membrane protein A